MVAQAWKVSLHGGHSGQFCEHASGTLRETLDAAAAAGCRTYGVSEHAPRPASRYLYQSEIDKGYDVERLERDFVDYAEASARLQEEFEALNGLSVLRGFEAEVVPAQTYAGRMLELRRRYRFDYIVGSVHYVGDLLIDGPPQVFEEAVEAQGGLEALLLRYYRQVAEMVEALRPEVVGHLDLPRLNAPDKAVLRAPCVKRAAEEALQAVRQADAILDLNTAGYRKGLGTPYPDAWLVRLADRMGIGFCFGDDSHHPGDVGAGLEESREYLLSNGVREIHTLRRCDGGVERERVEL